MLVKRMVSTGRRFANLGLQMWGLGMACTGFRAFRYVEDVFARLALSIMYEDCMRFLSKDAKNNKLTFTR